MHNHFVHFIFPQGLRSPLMHFFPAFLIIPAFHLIFNLASNLLNRVAEFRKGLVAHHRDRPLAVNKHLELVLRFIPVISPPLFDLVLVQTTGAVFRLQQYLLHVLALELDHSESLRHS